ncbi:MAG: GTPase (G3E family), partial [Eubacterium sp.]|nr:GTPase (G3E family) [Eubacterium sp.]
MTKIDLITGFLGSGKTTFLLKYAKYLMRQGLKIGILEYDYGAINVDMLLLNQLRGDRCELEMVAAACDEDCLKRRFRTKLIS